MTSHVMSFACSGLAIVCKIRVRNGVSIDSRLTVERHARLVLGDPGCLKPFSFSRVLRVFQLSIVHYVVLRKIEEMEIQTVMKRNEEGRRSSSSVFFHRTFSYFYKFPLVNF
jgi:hypothetical protein